VESTLQTSTRHGWNMKGALALAAMDKAAPSSEAQVLMVSGRQAGRDVAIDGIWCAVTEARLEVEDVEIKTGCRTRGLKLTPHSSKVW
jgi:hypothetical protein